MEPAQTGRFWPISPRLWRRSKEYPKVVFENRRPVQVPSEIKETPPRITQIYPRDSQVYPDLIRTRSFRDRELSRKSLEPLHLEETWEHKEHSWSVQKPPVKVAKREEVKLRTKKQRHPRPNSLQLLLCPSSSGHYSSSTWRYTRMRSKRFVPATVCGHYNIR